LEAKRVTRRETIYHGVHTIGIKSWPVSRSYEH